MNLSTAERKLLQALGSLANKLMGSKAATKNSKSSAGRRAGRSRVESEQMKKEILAAVRKGTPVREVAESHGVTSPYVYQLISKSGIKGKKRKAAA